nr:hypothetical protein [Tanacetum cinerariifolium]
CLSRFQMLTSMLSPSGLICSGGSDGESGLDLLRGEDSNSDESSGYRSKKKKMWDKVWSWCCDNLGLYVSIVCKIKVTWQNEMYHGMMGDGCLSRFQMLTSMLSPSGLICSGGSDGESGLDLLRGEDSNSDESSGYRSKKKKMWDK